MDDLIRLSQDPRVTVRRAGSPAPDGACVVYWMQRAQRGIDNPALDVAVDAANALRKPVVVFLAPVPFYPNANLRHYRFLAEGIPDIAAALAKRNIGFVLRFFPEHSLLRFCDEVKAALVIGDENPMREPEAWRRAAARKLKVPLWTVDADVIVPSKLLGEGAICRAHHPATFAGAPETIPGPVEQSARSREVEEAARLLLRSSPHFDITQGWKMDRSVSPVSVWRGGSNAALQLLRSSSSSHNLRRYRTQRNKPEITTPADCLHICISAMSARSR